MATAEQPHWGYDVETPEHAEALLHRLAGLEARMGAISQSAAQQRDPYERVISEVNAWELAQLGRLQSEYDAVLPRLEAFHRTQYARAALLSRQTGGPKAEKTFSRPFGEIKLKNVPASVAWVDDAATLAWAQEHHPEFMRNGKQAVDKTELAKHIIATGTAVPGTDLAEAQKGAHGKVTVKTKCTKLALVLPEREDTGVVGEIADAFEAQVEGTDDVPESGAQAE